VFDLPRLRRGVCSAFGSACGAACSRPPGVSRPSRRDSRLRRMRFDGSDARRAANGSLVRLAPWWPGWGRDEWSRHAAHPSRSIR